MSLRMLFSGLTVLVFCLMVAVQAESRTWTDRTGKFQAEAEFVRLSGDTVYLKKPNGATVAVPLNRLSPADQRFARQAAAAPAGRGRGAPAGNESSDTADSRRTAKKYALLSAVNRYRHDRMNDSKLKFPEADAAAVAELLRGSGYTVDLLLGKNATRRAIQDTLEKAGRQGTAGGAVLLGFFGHGVQYGDLAYYGPYDTSVRIVKVDGRTIREDDGRPKLEPDPESMVSMRTILDALTACGASNRILLADCCREDPSRARGRNAFGSTLTTRDLPPGTVALFACSKDEQAFEHDDWEHGAFTYAFLQHSSLLARSGKVLSGTLSDKLFESVKDMVEDKTDQRYTQTVYSLSSGTVDFQITSAVNLPKRVDVPVRPTPGTPPRPVTGRKAGDEIADNGLNMKFCWIPPGTFTMGSPQSEEGRYDDEKQVRVTLTRGFWLGKYEVTQGEWRRVMNSEPWKGKNYVREGDRYAAMYVSWDDARTFCQTLTQQERAAGRLGADEEYRLPTEAEWEYACRAGTETAYSFGSDASRLSDYAWFDENARNVDEKYAHEVGGKLVNPWGLHDIHGNVWEWCEDVYVGQLPGGSDPKVTSGGSDRVRFPGEGSFRVYRGGGWFNSSRFCRASDRSGIVPAARGRDLGFRVAQGSVQ